MPGYEAVGATGMFAPGKTSSSIINQLNREITRELTKADVRQRMLNVGGEIVASSPEQFAAAIKSELAAMSKVIREAGIRVD